MAKKGVKPKSKPKKKSQTQIEYERERGRITRQINRMKKRGYLFEETPLPPKPDKIGKRELSKLKKLTTEELYKKAILLDYETGEIIEGEKGKEYEKQKQKEKRQEEKKRKRKKPTYDDEYGEGDIFTPPPISYADFSVADEIIDRVKEIPDYMWYGKDKRIFFEEDKFNMVSLLNDRIAVAEESGTLDEYLSYLREVKDDIVEKCEALATYQEATAVPVLFGDIAKLILGRTMSLEEATRVSELSEGYENWNEY